MCRGHACTLIMFRLSTSSYDSTVAQEEYIQNFQVLGQTGPHITFSWDIVDGYYSSSSIQNFDLQYQSWSESIASKYIRYSSTVQNTNTNGVVTFMSNISTERYSHGEYIMWIRVTRLSLAPRYTYSRKRLVNISESPFSMTC